MKKRKIFYLLVSMLLLCGFTSPKQDLKITYLGNCSYLYESARSKVVIDPFGTEYGNYFYLPSNDTKQNIIKGNAPFDKVNLLLITHIHGDHFNAKLTEKFLLNNRKAKMICPQQVYMQMRDSCKSFARIKSQIISPDLAMNGSKKINANGVPITVIRMQHGTNRSLVGIDYSNYTNYEKTEDFGYVIHFGKKTVFHQGDGCLKINEKALNKIDCPIDIAYLGFFDWDSASLNIVKNKLKAKSVIFMHGTKPAKELELDSFKKIAPQLIFFKSELESKIFE